MADRVTSRSLTTLLNYVIQAFGERRDHGRGGPVISRPGIDITSYWEVHGHDRGGRVGVEYLGRKGKQDKVFWFCDVTWQLFLGWCTGHIIILYVTLILCVWFLVNLSVRPPHLCFLECWYPRTQVALLKVNYRTIKLWCSVLLIISVTASHQMRRETFNQTFHLHFILMVISPE